MSINTLAAVSARLQANINPYTPAPAQPLAPVLDSLPPEGGGIIPASSGSTDQVSSPEQLALLNSQTILTAGRQNMSTAMQSFATDWEAAKTRIASMRPDLLNQRWDIITDQGTIQVLGGSMSESDRAWLTGVLNQNTALVADTQTINTVMVSTFGGTAAMAAQDPLGMTLSSLNSNSVDGSVHFLALLAGADNEVYQTGGSSSAGTDLQLAAVGSSTMNLPNVSQIDAVNSLGIKTVMRDHVQYQLQADKSMQGKAYSDALNIAFQQFLSPGFSATSAADGTAVSYPNDPAADKITSLIEAANNPMGAMTSLSDNAARLTGGIAGGDSDSTEQMLQQQLGAGYRSYGEAAQPAASTAGQADTSTGAGSIQDLYDNQNAVLTPAQQSLQTVEQSFGADWEVSKQAIAAVRPDLLQDNWDFVSNNDTLMATSSTLGQEQKLWLTAKLNQNNNLVSDTQAINAALVDFYRNQYASDTNVLDSVAYYNGPSNLDLSNLTLPGIDGRVGYLALMGGENPTQALVQSATQQSPLLL